MADEGVKLVKSEPNYKLHFHDGISISLSTDIAEMKSTIETWEGKDGFSRYLSFLQESHNHYENSVEHVLRKSYPSFFSLLKPAILKVLLGMHPFESIWTRAALYFRSERLRRAFTFGSMYMGMSPFDAPGTYSLLQYTELAEGIWSPIGGFWAVIEALVKVGQRLGIEYRLNTPVKSIITSSNPTKPGKTQATGVVLENGEQLSADVVIINADLIYASNHLLPQTPRAIALGSKTTSCSSISFYWALDTKIPELQPHNIFLAEKYRESFDEIFKNHRLPSDPSFYVNVPSRLDPTAAPEGCDSLVILLPCGHLPPDSAAQQPADLKGIPASAFAELVPKARESILQVLESRLGVDIRSHIKHEVINEPSVWKQKFNLDRGAILGLSHDFFNVLCFRPQIRSPDHDGLWFVGASTHPGTGVPIVLAGSKLVAEDILSVHGEKRMPWRTGWMIEATKKKGKEISSFMDRERRHWRDPGKYTAWITLPFLLTFFITTILFQCLLPSDITFYGIWLKYQEHKARNRL
jgi:phytoene desaturase (3,4-didehydrolycopene-forming)